MTIEVRFDKSLTSANIPELVQRTEALIALELRLDNGSGEQVRVLPESVVLALDGEPLGEFVADCARAEKHIMTYEEAASGKYDSYSSTRFERWFGRTFSGSSHRKRVDHGKRVICEMQFPMEPVPEGTDDHGFLYFAIDAEECMELMRGDTGELDASFEFAIGGDTVSCTVRETPDAASIVQIALHRSTP